MGEPKNWMPPSNGAKISEFIVMEGVRGRGEHNDTHRRVIKIFSKDGEFVAEFDPCAPVYNNTHGTFDYKNTVHPE